MKKITVLLLAALMLLSLVACGGTADETTGPETTTQQTTTQETTGADLKALAESCIDKSVEELYSLIGQPVSSDYAPSCLNPGEGEDGNLYYDGFTVYTYREGDEETVTYVE